MIEWKNLKEELPEAGSIFIVAIKQGSSPWTIVTSRMDDNDRTAFNAEGEYWWCNINDINFPEINNDK